MLWMGVKRPLCPYCDSGMPMKRKLIRSEISSMKDAKEYWVCDKCHRRYPIRDR